MNTAGMRKKLLKVKSHTKKPSGKLQIQLLANEIRFFAQNGSDMRSMHRMFRTNGKFIGCYDTFLKHIKADLPDVYQIYTKKKDKANVAKNI